MGGRGSIDALQLIFISIVLILVCVSFIALLTMGLVQYLFACVFLCSYLVCASSQFSCNTALYGMPREKDCFDLYNQLPGGSVSPDINIDVWRCFVEPKFLQPAFCPVHNPLGASMVQLPKIWRYSELTLDISFRWDISFLTKNI